MTEQLNDAQKLLTDAKTLIVTRGWGQGSGWKCWGSQEPCNFCSLGAVQFAANSKTISYDLYRSVRLSLSRAIEELFPGYGDSIVSFNDAERRTKEEVLQVFDRAITLAA